MAHSERARPSRNSSTSLGCLAISPPRTATPRQRQHALPSQAEFVLCEQTIYQVYCGWSLDQKLQIGRRLVQHSAQTRWTKPHLLELLIQAALPKIKRQVVLSWSDYDAIRLGQACHVQPSKLRAFLFARDGLVRCAQEFRERQAEEERREEEQRQMEEDERAGKRRQKA